MDSHEPQPVLVEGVCGTEVRRGPWLKLLELNMDYLEFPQRILHNRWVLSRPDGLRSRLDVFDPDAVEIGTCGWTPGITHFGPFIGPTG